jgi:hypothetical protein
MPHASYPDLQRVSGTVTCQVTLPQAWHTATIELIDRSVYATTDNKNIAGSASTQTRLTLLALDDDDLLGMREILLAASDVREGVAKVEDACMPKYKVQPAICRTCKTLHALARQILAANLSRPILSAVYSEHAKLLHC